MIGVGILDIGINKPVVGGLKGGQTRYDIGTLQGIFRKNARRVVCIVERQDELVSAGPSALLVLRHLYDRRPVVVEPAVCASEHGSLRQSVCNTHARLDIVVGVVPEAAVGRNDNMRRERAIGRGNAGRHVASGRTRRRRGREDVVARIQIPVANGYVAIRRAAVKRIEPDVIARSQIHRQPVGDFPLILKVESINPAPVFSLKLVAIGIA